MGAEVRFRVYEARGQPEHHSLQRLPVCTDDLTVQLTVSDQC